MRYYIAIFFFILSVSGYSQYTPFAGGTFNSTNDLQTRVGYPYTTSTVSGLRGGPFMWMPLSTATPDSGIVFKVPGVTLGRWIRQFNPQDGIQPEWFGAIGDSITNSSAPLLQLFNYVKNNPSNSTIRLYPNSKYITTPFKMTDMPSFFIDGNGAGFYIKDTTIDYYAGVDIIGVPGGNYIINNCVFNNENAHSGTASANNRWIPFHIAGGTNVELIESVTMNNCITYGVGRNNGVNVSTNVNANNFELSAKNITLAGCRSYNAGYSGYRVAAINSKITDCSSFYTHQRDLSMLGQFMFLINAASPGDTQITTNYPVVYGDSVILDYQNTKQRVFVTSSVPSGNNYVVTFRPALTASISTSVLNQPITGSIFISNFTGNHTDSTTDNAGGGLVLDGGANIFRSISISGLTLNGPMASAGLKARNFVDFKVDHYTYSINYSKAAWNPYAMVADVGPNGSVYLSNSTLQGSSFFYAKNVIINDVTVRGLDTTIVPGYGVNTDYAFQVGAPNVNISINNLIVDSTKFVLKHLDGKYLQSVNASNITFNSYTGSGGYMFFYDTIPPIKSNFSNIVTTNANQYLLNAGSGGNPWLYKLSGTYTAPTLPTLSQHGSFKVGDILVYNTGFTNLISICTGAGDYLTSTWQSLTPIKDGSILNIGSGYLKVVEPGHIEVWPKTDPALTARLIFGADSALLRYHFNATYSSGTQKFGFDWQYGGVTSQTFTSTGAGFGITSPTAIVHIGAGSTTRAQFRLQGSPTIVSGFNNGDIWHDSTTANLGIYARLNGVITKLNNDPFTRTDSASVVNDSTIRFYQKYANGTSNTFDLQVRGGNHGGGSGTGTVNQVNTNNNSGITGGPITNTGTIAADTANILSTRAFRQKGLDSMAAVISGAYVSLSGSYADPSWLTSLAASKITGTQTSTFISDFTTASQAVGDARYVQLLGSYADPSWITSLAYSKLTGVPRWVDSVYRKNDSTFTVRMKQPAGTFSTYDVEILGSSGGGSGGGVTAQQIKDSILALAVLNRTSSDPQQSGGTNLTGKLISGTLQTKSLVDSSASFFAMVDSSGNFYRSAPSSIAAYRLLGTGSSSGLPGPLANIDSNYLATGFHTTGFYDARYAGAGTGVTSISNSDGTLTISPTTGAAVASLNLSNANTFLIGQTARVDNIAVAETAGLVTRNNSSAISGTQQMPPYISMIGSGYGTTGSAAQTVETRFSTLPVQGTTPTSTFRIGSIINGGTETFPLSLASTGALTVLGAVTGTSFSNSGSSGKVTITTSTIGTTSTDGLILQNSSPAVVGTQVQQTARQRWSGKAWDGSASEDMEMWNELRPVAGSGSITGNFFWTYRVNGGTANDRMKLSNVGDLSLLSGGLTISTAGKGITIAEGTDGRSGSTTLSSGVSTITINGLTTSSRAFVAITTTGGTLGAGYKVVCTANTLTITSVAAAGTTQTLDTSTLSYFVIN